jgi:disulfide bond formation protein DsbB
MKFMPVWQLIRKVLTGSGECGLVTWRFLGLAMPAWVLLWALALGTAGVLGNLRREASAAR